MNKILLAVISIGIGLYAGLFILPYRFSEQSPLSREDLSGIYDPNHTVGVFHGQTEMSRFLPAGLFQTDTLGATSSDKRIEVDLTNQKLYAFEGNNKIYEFPVSTGKWYPTPTGTFHIWIKLRYTRMQGGNPAWHTYYNLPNVPFTMYFANDEIPQSSGFGIHGAYWHNNFGHPMSHGCVNMSIDDAGVIYNWADPALNGSTSVRATQENPGTTVVIYGETPKE